MHIYKKTLLAFGFLLAANHNALALADKVIAKIDGVEIWQSELAFAESELGSELARVPVIERRAVLLRYIVDTQLMANAAKKAKLDSSENFKKRQAYYQRRALRDAYFEKSVRDSVTDAQAKKLYNQVFNNKKPKIEVRAAHILVKTENEAKEIIQTLKGGADFAKLASEKSTGPSKTQGGDLGYFTKGRMVKAFETAAFSLKKGGLSTPIKTKFGWHIIKLNDKREKPNPPFETLKSRIMTPLIQQKSRSVIESLRKASKLEVLDSNIKSHMKDVE